MFNFVLTSIFKAMRNAICTEIIMRLGVGWLIHTLHYSSEAQLSYVVYEFNCLHCTVWLGGIVVYPKIFSFDVTQYLLTKYWNGII